MQTVAPSRLNLSSGCCLSRVWFLLKAETAQGAAGECRFLKKLTFVLLVAGECAARLSYFALGKRVALFCGFGRISQTF